MALDDHHDDDQRDKDEGLRSQHPPHLGDVIVGGLRAHNLDQTRQLGRRGVQLADGCTDMCRRCPLLAGLIFLRGELRHRAAPTSQNIEIGTRTKTMSMDATNIPTTTIRR